VTLQREAVVASKYRIVRRSVPGLVDRYVAQVYKTREAPNGDYWDDLLSAMSHEKAKEELLKSLMKEIVVEEFYV
jgi:hypothetical protein